MKIMWRDALSVDNGPIDADHKYLIELINELTGLEGTTSLDERFVEILGELKKYTKVHFRREEALQKAADFPECDEHEKEHADLERKLDAIIRVAKKEIDKGATRNQSKIILEQTQKFLKTWLLQHVIGHDLKMKDYVGRMKEKAKSMSPIEDDPIFLD